ncbi:DUF397 domain-containing protein [Polymorphospora sp. NPDC050346]|uniref:DUF397 domain-containing protein n=1 Tax=Polymorphospora sp. NPDC050346 TaxID=3155780 RepID=UPI0033DFD735
MGQSERWRRSSRCEAHNCVEVAYRSGQVLVRNSQYPDGGVLAIDPDSWTSFCVALRTGELHG